MPRSLWITCLLLAPLAASELRQAPSPDSPPVNQLAVAGNACGPAALLNAFQAGNPQWRRAFSRIPGTSDRERILSIIRHQGMRPSRHAPGRPRWSRRGISLADLRDVGDEITQGLYLPQLAEEVFVRSPRESQEKLLARVHRRLDQSLSRGLPPVLSLRRHAFARQPGKNAGWSVIDAHFVTVTALPRKLPRHARSFQVSYLDPWGGRKLQGEIAIAEETIMPDATNQSTSLVARFPDSPVGLKRVPSGRQSVLIPAAAIGRW